MEAQFAVNGITQDLTKFYHILHFFDTNVLAKISELVTNPTQNTKYEELKTHLLSEFQDSEEKSIAKSSGTRGSASITLIKTHERSRRRQNIRQFTQVVMDATLTEKYANRTCYQRRCIR